MLLTLALVSGGYAIAKALYFSAPLAMVAAGLLVGYLGTLKSTKINCLKSLSNFGSPWLKF